MTSVAKPTRRPANPRFSSGPCTKRPGWSVEALKGALLGRNHRQAEVKARLELALTKTRDLLQLPPGEGKPLFMEPLHIVSHAASSKDLVISTSVQSHACTGFVAEPSVFLQTPVDSAE